MISALQKIYDSIGISFNIKEEPVMDISSIVQGNEIVSEDAEAMSSYSQQQQQINAMYKGQSNDRYVVFITSKRASTGQGGYMRLNGQYGYVYGNAETKTLAHEIGHGVFRLEHPWSKYKTPKNSSNLLLDYKAGGRELCHLDWKQINDPAFKLYAFQSQEQGAWETDGHYSTVYLVCLMLGMDEILAKQLAIATEAPDTKIHDETTFELNDTWADKEKQESIHTLTGGFHGTENFLSAVQFLYTPKSNIQKLGELLHRFGDSYAHTKLDNIKPADLQSYNLSDNTENKSKVILSWKGQGGNNLQNQIEPWIKHFNACFNNYGIEFLSNIELQKSLYNGQTLKEILADIYLIDPTSKFIMYGGKKMLGGIGLTDDHFASDKGYPDKIYLRPEWYLTYVKNLAWLIARKYNLDESKLNMNIFQKMTDLATKNQCSLKGIIDYEITKKLGQTKFYIPVFYSEPTSFFASWDALKETDYYKDAENVVEKTKQYIQLDNLYKNFIVTPIKDNNIKVNFGTGFFHTRAFEINLKP